MEVREGRQPQQTYVVFDVETTGLGPRARIVEFACLVVTDRGAVVDGFDTLVDPRGPVGPTWLHGIDQAMVRGAPTFGDVAGRIEATLRDRVHVGHNVMFDQRALARELGLLGVTFPRIHSGVCTAGLAEQVLGRRLSLTAACTALGIAHIAPHRAATDVRATAALLAALSDAVPARRPCPPFPGAWRLPAAGPLTPRLPEAYDGARRRTSPRGGVGG